MELVKRRTFNGIEFKRVLRWFKRSQAGFFKETLMAGFCLGVLFVESLICGSKLVRRHAPDLAPEELGEMHHRVWRDVL